MVAPCKCSFTKAKNSGPEGLYYNSKTGDHISPCPESNEPCFLRPFYVNHSTKEITTRCPCVTCSQQPVGDPCVSLRAFFENAEPDGMDEDEAPLIPDQNLSLSDYFNDLPPEFGLADTHIDSKAEARDESLTQIRPVSNPLLSASDAKHFHNRVPGLLNSVGSIFFSRKIASSNPLNNPPPISLHEALEVTAGLMAAVLLVVTYEMMSVYRYIQELPTPPAFLWKMTILSLALIVLRYLRYGIF